MLQNVQDILWELKNIKTGETLDDLESKQEGHHLEVVFPEVNELWHVHLTEVNATSNEVMRWVSSEKVKTKYVRREIRSLSDADRER